MSKHHSRTVYHISNKMEQAYENATKLLRAKLFSPYQEEGVKWMLSKELATDTDIKGGFLCDEMGLGKTIQLISVMLGNPKDKTLVVCPKSVIPQWQNEVEKFAPYIKTSSDIKELDNVDIFITTYATFRDELPKRPEKCKKLLRVRWGRVILDEGHEIRNGGSNTHVCIAELHAIHKWVVSGTPIYNSIKDFMALSSFLGIEPKVAQIFPERVRTKFLIRRTKEDVCFYNENLKLPPCHFENVEVPMYPEEDALYCEVFDQAQKEIKQIMKYRKSSGMQAMQIFEWLLRCRQLLIHPTIYLKGIARKNGEEFIPWEFKSRKTELLVENIMSHPFDKSLIFCHFIEEMLIFTKALLEKGIKVCYLDGSLDNGEREQQMKKFRETEDHTVFIIQIKSGGVGLNLQAATRVYIMSPSWNPATELQAIGRSHRTGQTNPVVVKKFISIPVSGTPSMEEGIMNLQGHKSVVCAEVLNDERLLEQIPTKLKKVNNSIKITDVAKLFSMPKSK